MTANRWLNRSLWIYALAATLALVLLYQCSNQENTALTIEVQELKKRPLDKDVTFWKDKYNYEHATTEQLSLNKEQINQYWSDSIAKILKIRPNQVVGVGIVKTGIEINEPITTNPITVADTTSEDGYRVGYEISFENKPWINVYGTVNTDNDSISITGIDTIYRTDYWKRKWFLGRKSYYSDYTNKNPYIKIEGVREVNKQERDPIFIIAPSLNIGYPFSGFDWSRPQGYFGASIIYYPFSVKIR